MTRSLEYTNIITKIPIPKKVTYSDYYLLPCVNDHSLVVIYNNPLDILGIIKPAPKSTISHKIKLEILLRGRQIILELK